MRQVIQRVTSRGSPATYQSGVPDDLKSDGKFKKTGFLLGLPVFCILNQNCANIEALAPRTGL